MYDLLVIGGGPAGATCARRAAECGLDVVLVEKEVHPRPKHCGGALSSRAIELLDFDISQTIERDFNAALIHTPTGRETLLTRKGFRAYLIERSKFDELLLEKAREAGVEIVQGCKIVAIEQLQKGIRGLGIGDSYKAHLLVGADGVNGITCKELNIRNRWDPKSVALCITAEFPLNPSDIETVMSIEGSEKHVIRFYYGLVDLGYGWCFPKRNSLNIGIGCRLDKAKNLRNRWNTLVSRIEESTNVKLNVTGKTSARIPLGHIGSRYIARRSMIIGDAAGLVSAASGEGISYAIESGLLAANVAYKAVKDKSPVHIIEYEKKLKHQLLRELEDMRNLSNYIYGSKENIDIICQIVEEDSVMMEYLMDMITRRSPNSNLLNKIRRRMILHHPLKAIKLGLQR